MPDRAVTGLALGFFGKLPARGDFVRAGLPRDFVGPWDDWWQRSLAAIAEMAEDWTAAWLEAPIWRFQLPPGLCGAGAVLGLWLPSVDRAGRYFPLTLAAIGAPAVLTGAAGFLDGAEQAGLDALAHDLDPETLGGRITAAFGTGDAAPIPDGPAGCAVWWTEGSNRVAPATLATPGLPSTAAFAGMIDNDWAAAGAHP